MSLGMGRKTRREPRKGREPRFGYKRYRVKGSLVGRFFGMTTDPFRRDPASRQRGRHAQRHGQSNFDRSVSPPPQSYVPQAKPHHV